MHTLTKYQSTFKFLQNEFTFIQHSYYTHDDLNDQIASLTREIQQTHQLLSEENQLSERKRLFESRGGEESGKGKGFGKVYYLKAVRRREGDPDKRMKAIDDNSKPEDGKKGENYMLVKQFSSKQQHYNKFSFTPSSSTPSLPLNLHPNTRLTLHFTLHTIEPILPYLNSSQRPSTPIFPPNFTLHLHHLHTQLSTQLHYSPNIGVYQTGEVINGRYIMTAAYSTAYDTNDSCSSIQRRSSKHMSLAYTFRHSNIDMYTQLLSQEHNQNLVFSLTNTEDKSDIIIAMAKVDLKEVLERRRGQKEENVDQQVVIYFRTMISFGEVCPLEELPLFCRMRVGVSVREEVVSPLVEEFGGLVVNNTNKGHDNNRQSASSILHRNSLMKPSSNHHTKSPTKIIIQSPSKHPHSPSPSTGKSPHHKKHYIKSLLQQPNPTPHQQPINPTTQRNTTPTKYTEAKLALQGSVKKTQPYCQKLQCIDQVEVKFGVRGWAVLEGDRSAYRFPGELLSMIEQQVLLESIIIDQCENVHLKQKMLEPLIQLIASQDASSKLYHHPSKPSPYTDYVEDDPQSDDYAEVALPSFSIMIKANICLKDKDVQGRISIKLPFVEKLVKEMATKEGGRRINVPHWFSIMVQPNRLFSIEQFDTVQEQIDTHLKSSHTNKNKSPYHPSSSSHPTSPIPTLSTKLTRLTSNLYTPSLSLLHTHITRSLQLHQPIDNFYNCAYTFHIQTRQLYHKQQVRFFVYPYGVVFDVVEKVGGGYVVRFGVEAERYRGYVDGGRGKENGKGEDGFFLVDVAISCEVRLKGQKGGQEKEEEIGESSTRKGTTMPTMLSVSTMKTSSIAHKSTKPIQSQTPPPSSLSNSSTLPSRTITQLQFLQLKLPIHPPPSPTTTSYRQIHLPSPSQQFCHLPMQFLAKENTRYNIWSLSPEILNVVNGEGFMYSEVSDRLVLQLVGVVKEGESIKVGLLMENVQTRVVAKVQLRVGYRGEKKKEENMVADKELY